MNDQDLYKEIEQFIGSDKEREFKAKKANKHYIIDFKDLIRFNPELADILIDSPHKFFSISELVIKEIGGKQLPLRIKNFHSNKSSSLLISNKRVEHLNKLWWFEGIVKIISEVKPITTECKFVCPSCQTTTTLNQVGQSIKTPNKCGCGRKGKFKELESKRDDVMKLVLEEDFEAIETDQQPERLNVLLAKGLTTTEIRKMVTPGKKVIITGTLEDRPKSTKAGESLEREWVLIANYVEPIDDSDYTIKITNEDEIKIKKFSKDPQVYNKLIDSVTPEIHGYRQEKLALVLQSFGAVTKRHPTTNKVLKRGSFHIGFIGDPGCLVYDERVVLSNGTIMLLGEMGESHLEEINYKVHIGKGHNFGRADRFHKYEQQPIMEIITETGKSIKGTYNQKILLNQNQSQEWRRLDQVKIGDKVQGIPKIKCSVKSYVPTNWKRINIKKTFNHIIPKKPKYVDENLAAIMGHIISDGYVEKYRIGHCFNNQELGVADKLTQLYHDCFNTTIIKGTHKHTSDKVIYYTSHSKQIASWLSICKKKRIPSVIFKSNNSVVSSFLSWLFDGDGCVFCNGRGKTAISYKSIDIELLRDIQIILLRFGIQSRIIWDNKKRKSKIRGKVVNGNPSGNLMIRRGESILKFKKYINFVNVKKRNKLNKTCDYVRKRFNRTRKIKAERIVSINKLGYSTVYDIEVPIHNRFIANGLVVHNTAKTSLGKGLKRILPKCRSASGKHASGAGLTWGANYDEFMKSWTIEAGVLVLASGGTAIIDEADKIDKEQLGRVNQGLENGSFEATKMSIQTTLKSDTACLFIANPKHGRFTDYESKIQQVEMDPALISRLSLIFVFQDLIDPERDEAIASHIFQTHSKMTDVFKTELSEEFIKKYIIYAKKNSNPILDISLKKHVVEKYKQLRTSTDERSRVIITPRQFEDIIRLSESFARVRLASKITKKDIDMAFDLMLYSLKQFAIDSAGNIDIDTIELGGKTHEVRSRTEKFEGALRELGGDKNNLVEVQTLVNKLIDLGLNEMEIEKLIDKAKMEGVIMETKRGYVKRLE